MNTFDVSSLLFYLSKSEINPGQVIKNQVNAQRKSTFIFVT